MKSEEFYLIFWLEVSHGDTGGVDPVEDKTHQESEELETPDDGNHGVEVSLSYFEVATKSVADFGFSLDGLPREEEEA